MISAAFDFFTISAVFTPVRAITQPSAQTTFEDESVRGFLSSKFSFKAAREQPSPRVILEGFARAVPVYALPSDKPSKEQPVNVAVPFHTSSLKIHLGVVEVPVYVFLKVQSVAFR